ncbi:MAG: VOC family protein [bacterium]|nr:VOC family protein [bacterium]
MITIENLQQKLSAYGDEVKFFFHAYGLGDLVLDKPVDHVAVKALNRAEYEKYLEEYASLSKRLSYEVVSERDLATAELFEPLECGEFGQVTTLEIMEPKPDAAITTHDMIDHIELFVEDLEYVEKRLEDKGVEFTHQESPNHKAIAVSINEWDQEVKFADKHLVDIANQQINAKIAHIHE